MSSILSVISIAMISKDIMSEVIICVVNICLIEKIFILFVLFFYCKMIKSLPCLEPRNFYYYDKLI